MGYLRKTQDIIDYTFSDDKILKIALTHKSASQDHYETLEFLGDSILNYCISSMLFQKKTHFNEGQLSLLRAKLVNKKVLATLCQNLGIVDHIRTDKNQIKSPAICADVLESIIGAMYIDGGMPTCQQFVTKHFSPLLANIQQHELKDSKTLLQEMAHTLNRARPIYTIVLQEGKQHNKIYTISCRIGEFIAQAKAKSKRAAEQLAAKQVIKQLEENTL